VRVPRRSAGNAGSPSTAASSCWSSGRSSATVAPASARSPVAPEEDGASRHSRCERSPRCASRFPREALKARRSVRRGQPGGRAHTHTECVISVDGRSFRRVPEHRVASSAAANARGARVRFSQCLPRPVSSRTAAGICEDIHGLRWAARRVLASHSRARSSACMQPKRNFSALLDKRPAWLTVSS
jgi:hypothetical protein